MAQRISPSAAVFLWHLCWSYSSFVLLFSSLLNLYTSVRVRSFVITHHDEINPETEHLNYIDWDKIMFQHSEDSNVLLPASIDTFFPDLKINQTATNGSYQCNQTDASFSFTNRCYYITPAKYSFLDCFVTCDNYSQNYYFISPESNLQFIRQNLNRFETVWVGVFKSKYNKWQNLKGHAVSVHDVFNSYCAYIGYYTDSPWSSYFCDTPRPCLCGGIKSINSGTWTYRELNSTHQNFTQTS
ncbi:hypothetical protein [Rhinolophus gammaherpesvirus 1]|uniref:C-type lectin domain-containing protein n=1 Tax=Rhinolophus gammaherpesvirus 1 TaxID=2054179 RepID=A0A2Z5UHY4_9GAMA|nr:hypothetical protein [Rhinolophus gammaherpesvirus 1]BBB06502.1 hypothetical protein [Rhinolophus gammaherpesvirus 1]